MKVAQFGFVIGALNIAAAKANMFEEDFDEDFAMAELDDFAIDDFGTGRMLQNVDEDDGQSRRRFRRNRRNKKKGRKGKKGKGKGKKGPFDYNAFMAKLDEKTSNMEERVAKKCARKVKKMEKLYDFMATQGDEFAQFLEPQVAENYADAMEDKCTDMQTCKITKKIAKMRCEAQFRLVMKSFNQEEDDEEVDTMGFTPVNVGDCYTDVLESQQNNSCALAAKQKFADDTADLPQLDDATKAKIREAMKAARKAKRAEKKNKRRGNRNDRKNRKKNRRQNRRRNNNRDESEESESEMLLDEDVDLNL